MGYSGRKGSSYGNRIRHRRGTFKLKNEKGKQWIGGNQFVNAENNYAMKAQENPKKEPEKDFEPRKISHNERIQRLNYHRLMGNLH